MPRIPENLRFTLDVFDEAGNLIEVLGRLSDMSTATAAFWEAVSRFPDRRIFLRDRAHVIRRYDEPKPAALAQLANVQELRDALRHFTFPASPEAFQSEDGGCTEAIVPDEHVQLARRLVGHR